MGRLATHCESYTVAVAAGFTAGPARPVRTRASCRGGEALRAVSRGAEAGGRDHL